MKVKFWTLLFVLVFAASLVNAQVERGSVTGTVLDPQGRSVPNAEITVTDEQTGAVFAGNKTSSEGTFTVPGLPFGNYTVKVVAQGFATWETKHVSVITAQVASVEASLTIGSASETVTVEAGQTLVDTTSSELATHVDRKQIVDLPTTTRNPLDFATQLAGVTSTGSATSGGSIMNGIRGSSNNITQDGINIQDSFIKTAGFAASYDVSLEATGEFSISGQNIGADSGDGVVQIRVVTARGTNDYHGSVFYFGRNDAFNANSWRNNFLGTPKTRLHQHRFGGNIGGPVRIPKLYNGKDRTFVFFSYSGFREHFQTTADHGVLTALARTGIYEYKDSNGTLQTVNLLTTSSRGLPLNPFTMSLINATPLPVAGGPITIDPNNGDGLNTLGTRFNVSGSDPSNQYDLRVDQKAIESKKWGSHSIEVDWHWEHSVSIPGEIPAFPKGIATSCVGAVCNIAENFDNLTKVLSVGINSTLGTSMFNEFRVGMSRTHPTFLPPVPFPRAFKVDMPDPQAQDPDIGNAGAVRQGLTPEDNFDPQGRLSPYYAFIDNFTKIHGAHTFKTGFLISSASTHRINDFAGGLPNVAGIIPEYVLGLSSATNSDGLNNCATGFPNLPSGQVGINICNEARAIYADLTGLVNNVSQTYNGIPGQGFIPGLTDAFWLRERSYNPYFSDSWRMRPSFTLTLGLRYEFVPAVDMVNKRISVPGNAQGDILPFGPLFQPNSSVTFNQLLANLSSTTQLVPGGTSNGNPLWKTDWHNVAPSVGIAWQPISKTTVRGGYAVSYIRDTLTIVSNVATANAALHSQLATGPTPSSPLAVINPSVDGTPFVTPTLTLPKLQESNFIGSFTSSAASSGIEAFNNNLRTPYVQQWSLGVERELSSTTVLEVRYVGNHATKLYRANDYDQINLTPALLSEFNSVAASNGTAPGPTLTALNFTSIPGNLLTSSTFRNLYATGAAGQFWFLVQSNCTFNFLKGTGCSGLGSFAANTFISNPFTGSARLFTNGADSSYNGLQMEVRRRISSGLQFQANYTFAKVLSNTTTNGSQSELDVSADLHNPSFDRTRSAFDIRHTIHFNGLYELPVGRGRRWASRGIIGKALEGWQVGTLTTWRTGIPMSILSARTTVSQNGGADPAVAVGMTDQQVCSAIGVHKVPGQGAFYLPANFLVAGTNPGTTKTANFSILADPVAGSLGDHGLRNGCSGPGFVQADVNFVKKTQITERTNFEFRAEMFNIFNHPNFNPPAGPNINNSGFGVLTSTFTPREIQFNARFNF